MLHGKQRRGVLMDLEGCGRQTRRVCLQLPSLESSLIASTDTRWLIDHTGSLNTSLESLNLLDFPSAPMKAS
jgi:hypothetical protein